MAAKAKRVADYEETLAILSAMAREGDVRAAIALAGHLRKERHGEQPEITSAIDELAKRRTDRTAGA